MEYVPGGELFDYLVRRGRLPPLEALHYFQQIIHAVDYCHRFNICHRDLKPENLLLDKDKNIKVADFGMAAWQSEERLLETSCGSPHYASPEIVAGRTYNGTASDIWSCGIILFALLTGRLPFDDDNIRTLLQKVKAGVFDMPADIDPAAQDLLSRMLEKEPEERITMPEVMAHPFFTHHPLRLTGGRSMPTPLALGEMAKPVRGEDIDEDIMGNMRTLWHGASEGEIYKSLMSKDKTWEKAIYHLLVKYRNRHLENYNMDADSDDDLEDDRARPHTRAVATKRTSSKSRRAPAAAVHTATPPSSVRRKPAPLAENDSVQNRGTPPPRPQAPTPKKAAMSVGIESPVARTPSRLGPRSPAPAGPRSIRGPSSPAPPANQGPAIHLQEATPIKNDIAVATGDRALSPLPVTTPILSPRSPALAESPNTVPLSPPRVENPQLQTFLFEIANQLNSISIRSSTASDNSNSSAIQSPEFQAYLQYMVNQSPTPEGSQVDKTRTRGSTALETPPLEQDDQFADADDDETEADTASVYAASVHSTRMYTAPSPASSMRSPVSPAVGLGLGAAPRAPSRNGPPPVSGRWSHNSGSYRTRSLSSRPESPAFTSPPIHTPGTPYDIGGTSLPAVPPTALKAQRSAPAPPRATRPAPPRPTAVSEQHVESFLGREDSYAIIECADIDGVTADVWGSSNNTRSSAFSAHRAADGFGMLRKRKKSDAAAPVADTTGKRSWFNNLFSFKPAACEIFLNTPTISDGRKATIRALDGLRVTVKESVDAGGLSYLKCKMPDMRDAGETIKGVRFRVEFDRVSVNTSRSVFRTQVMLTLERGAHSTFKSIYQRLKAELESPSTPASSGYPSIPTRSRAQRPALFANDGTLKVDAQPTRAGSEPNSPVYGQSPFRHPHYQSQPAPVRL